MIARFAEAQHGCVSREQLLEAGLGRRAIDYRIKRKQLIPVHRGVFGLGIAPATREGRLKAALLAAGPMSAVSHRAAAELWGIEGGPSPVEISALRSRGNLGGVIVHRPRSLEEDVVELEGLRVTAPARTLIDLCASLSASHVARLWNEAQIKRLVTRADLAVILDRSYGRRGINKLKRFAGDETPPTRSQLEKRFVRLVADAGLPAPRTNESLWVGGRIRELDACWPDLKLAVELDSWKFHGVRESFESDRERDVAFLVDGWRVARFTWARLRDDRSGVIRDLTRLIKALG